MAEASPCILALTDSKESVLLEGLLFNNLFLAISVFTFLYFATYQTNNSLFLIFTAYFKNVVYRVYFESHKAESTGSKKLI